MELNIKSFADQMRPSAKKPAPKPFSKSIFDAGSPQFIPPENLYLDIQSTIFGIKRKGEKDLSGIDPNDFAKRWKLYGAPQIPVETVGSLKREDLLNPLASLLRCPERKKENHKTLLPIVPTLGFYKNISPKLPNFFYDQLCPLFSFYDDMGFHQRIFNLKKCFSVNQDEQDSIEHLASSMLTAPSGFDEVTTLHPLHIHDGPFVRDYSTAAPVPMQICQCLIDAIDTLVSMRLSLPKILWSRWMISILRIGLPLFFLKRCSLASKGSEILQKTLKTSKVLTSKELSNSLIGSKNILRGSQEWLNQLGPLIQGHVRGRFEISIMLELSNLFEALVEKGLDPSNAAHCSNIKSELSQYSTTANPFPDAVGIFRSVKLSMPEDIGGNRLPFNTWLDWLVKNEIALNCLARLIGSQDVPDLINKVYDFIRPDYESLKNTFSKNKHEFVRYNLGAPLKSDRDPLMPDEYNLLYRGEKGRRSGQTKVHPGPELLKLLVQIVSFQAKENHKTTAKLGNLLDLFDDLGVDFRSNPNDFEIFKEQLLKIGLLHSSADAAEAASLKPLYSF